LEVGAVARSSFLERHHFLFRRLHSLSGVVPIGTFLLVHLTTNSSVVWGSINRVHGDVHGGAATFQHEVNFIHSLPFLLLIEIFILWLPIAFHAGFGVYYAVSGRPNTKHYRYGGNVRYTFQRVTAWIGLAFIVYHVGTLRWGFSRLIPGHMHWEADFAGSTLAAALQGSTDGMTVWGWIIVLFYFVGVTSLVYHLANGIWTAAITWGITITESAQKRFGYVCAALGAVLMVAGWASIIGFASLDYHAARTAEMQVNGPVLVEPGGDIVQEHATPAPIIGSESGIASETNNSVESDDERDG
jgi:succinate dehydrogenase / fumarate reductase cytochrome b subunit